MSRATAITAVFRSALVAVDTLDPDEQDAIICTLLALLAERKNKAPNPHKPGIRAMRNSRVDR